MPTMNIFDMTDLWNAGATTFTAVKMNATDTASASGSMLIDLQHNSTSLFHVLKSGAIHSKRSNYNITNANAAAIVVSNYSLTGSNADSMLDLSGTWNTSGTPTALKLNMTDAASASGSLLVDLQVGGVSQFSVGKAGQIALASGSTSTPTLNFSASSSGIHGRPGGALTITSGASNAFDVQSGGVTVRNVGGYYFSSGSDATSSPDIRLVRDAAGALGQRDGTNAQTFRVYNTFTDSSNYERAEHGWSGNRYAINLTNAGTGAARQEACFLGATGADWQVSAVQDNNVTVRYVALRTSPAVNGTTLGFTGRINGHFGFHDAVGAPSLVIPSGATNRWAFFGVTSAFPAIQRDGAGLSIVGANGASVSWIKVPGVTVANLPAAATAGVSARAFVTDALVPVFGAAVTGGGAVPVPVYSTGTEWRVG